MRVGYRVKKKVKETHVYLESYLQTYKLTVPSTRFWVSKYLNIVWQVAEKVNGRNIFLFLPPSRILFGLLPSKKKGKKKERKPDTCHPST